MESGLEDWRDVSHRALAELGRRRLYIKVSVLGPMLMSGILDVLFGPKRSGLSWMGAW